MPDQSAIATEVPDHFALLKKPRRPWLDPDSLKESFLELSATAHPDRLHEPTEPDRLAASRRFSEFNAAYQCLRESKDRLRYLLELESGSKPRDIDSAPAGMMDLFMELGQFLRKVDAFAVEKSKATSPVLQANIFERGIGLFDKLQSLKGSLNRRQEELTVELKKMNSVWDAVETLGEPRANLPLARLEEIYRELGFLGRWSAQLQERIVLLSL